jgi:hypothetical protein
VTVKPLTWILQASLRDRPQLEPAAVAAHARSIG